MQVSRVGRKRFTRSSLLAAITATFALFSQPTLSIDFYDPVAPVVEPLSEANSKQQLQLLDLEILVLKAELAQKSAEPLAVKNYLQEIAAMPGAESLSERINRLKNYLQNQPDAFAAPKVPFVFNPDNPVVLLPLSGPYQTAGNQILAGLESRFPYITLNVIDTAIYDTAQELWELVRLYQPSFIFGPLRPKFAQAFAEIDTQIPTLMFNEVATPHTQVRFLSPSRSAQMTNVVNRFYEQGYRKILLLSSSKDTPQLQAFINAADKITDPERFNIVKAPFKISIDQALEQGLGALGSIGRHVWLQKTIGERLQESIRARQDIDLVVSFLPFRSALQVTPILSYYHLNQVLHVWIPSDLPSAEVFASNLPFWQSTLALLPDFYINQVTEFLSKKALFVNANQPNAVINLAEESQMEPVGIFYALGHVAAEIVQEMTVSPLHQIPTSLGRVRWDDDKNIQIIPRYYWLDKGVIREQTP